MTGTHDVPQVCMVGAGSQGTGTIMPLIPQAGARLVGVCDIEREKAENATRYFGGRAYADVGRMLSREDPDGVIVAIGPEQHADVAIEAMQRGVPVCTEKPPAPSAADALEVARVSEETGVNCMTAFKKRYSSAYVRAREFIEQFDPEDRYTLGVERDAAPGYRDSDREFLHVNAIHTIDLVRYLYGEVEQVSTFQCEPDGYAINLRFDNGAVGSVLFNDGRPHCAPEVFEITIEGGNSMTIHNSGTWQVVEDGEPSEWRTPPIRSGGPVHHETGFLREFEAFVESIHEGTMTRSNSIESYRTMELYEAIERSAEVDRTIDVEYRL